MKLQQLGIALTITCLCLLTSCMPEDIIEDIIDEMFTTPTISVDITSEMLGTDQPLHFAYDSHRGGLVNSNFANAKFDHDDNYNLGHICVNYCLYHVPDSDWLTISEGMMVIQLYLPNVMNIYKTHIIEEPNEFKPDTPTGEIMIEFFRWNDEKNYHVFETYYAKTGTIKFYNRKYSDSSRSTSADIDFEFEVVDNETGEVILKAENGRMKDIVFNIEPDIYI